MTLAPAAIPAAAPHGPDAANTQSPTRPAHDRVITALLCLSGALTLAQAFVPLEEFIYRGDDAFYYFQIAYNYPRVGFWSFDTIHPTNGVQPLWAIMLTALAQVMSWLGVLDRDVFARTAVALGAVLHVASSILLYRLLARQVSLAVGVTVAAAFLLPLGIVWQRAWGMENSLYALTLVASVTYFHRAFRGQETNARAVVAGLLFGITALARLNAALFAVCAVAAVLVASRRLRLLGRLRYAVIISAVSASCVIPFVAWNYVETGHVLPISGAVKSVQTEQFLRDAAIDSPISPQFARRVLRLARNPVGWFMTSRAGDAFTILGGRLALAGNSRVDPRIIVPALAAVTLLPIAVAGVGAWLSALMSALRRLTPFGYLVAFALVNATVSILLYPQQVSYAMVRWWLVESEIVIVVLAGTLVGTAIGYMGTALFAAPVRRRITYMALATLIVAHAALMGRFYWNGHHQGYDWNASWTDDCFLAAEWLRDHVGADQRVGSWNAGVLGYYASQRVVNLDGLMNNFDLIPYLRNRDLVTYIRNEGITYLADMEETFRTYRISGGLSLREVYSHHSALMRQDYKIYRVEQ